MNPLTLLWCLEVALMALQLSFSPFNSVILNQIRTEPVNTLSVPSLADDCVFKSFSNPAWDMVESECSIEMKDK